MKSLGLLACIDPFIRNPMPIGNCPQSLHNVHTIKQLVNNAITHDCMLHDLVKIAGDAVIMGGMGRGVGRHCQKGPESLHRAQLPRTMAMLAMPSDCCDTLGDAANQASGGH